MEKEPNLAALLLKRKGDRSFERVSRDCGGNPSANRLQQIATKPLNEFPNPDTIRCLARGLPATITEVTLAAARSLGLSVAVGDPDALVVAGAGNLDAAAQDVILGVARELLKREDSSSGTVTELFPEDRALDEEERILFERYKLHAAYEAAEREETV